MIDRSAPDNADAIPRRIVRPVMILGRGGGAVRSPHQFFNEAFQEAVLVQAEIGAVLADHGHRKLRLRCLRGARLKDRFKDLMVGSAKQLHAQVGAEGQKAAEPFGDPTEASSEGQRLFVTVRFAKGRGQIRDNLRGGKDRRCARITPKLVLYIEHKVISRVISTIDAILLIFLTFFRALK